MKQYPRVYALLKRSGHSPFKAAEVLLDARRGDKLALAWIKGLRHLLKLKGT